MLTDGLKGVLNPAQHLRGFTSRNSHSIQVTGVFEITINT